jgi:hypothetical protein
MKLFICKTLRSLKEALAWWLAASGYEASETLVSNHQITRLNKPENHDFSYPPWKPRIMHQEPLLLIITTSSLASDILLSALVSKTLSRCSSLRISFKFTTKK